jgi:hypothetical protein
LAIEADIVSVDLGVMLLPYRGEIEYEANTVQKVQIESKIP